MNYQALGRLMVGDRFFRSIEKIIKAYHTEGLDGSLMVIDEDVGYICNVKDL